MRNIPVTMATQHPDHASTAYWHNQPYITTKEEVFECFHTFSDLGVDEYKWDWEGKFVDESVIERLLSDNFNYFTKHPLGKEKFLTFRLPNPKVETEFRMGRALMGIMTAAGLAKRVDLHTPPLFEVILPMTETAEEIIAVQEAFYELNSLRHPLLKFEDSPKMIEVIPLFEQVSVIANSADILRMHVKNLKAQFGITPSYLRPYMARSDPTLNSGNIATVLGIKIALSEYTKFEQETGINLFPIIGAACLPFRGGISPHTVREFTDEYAGIRTTLLQSAFRYDYPIEEVKTAIAQLKKILPHSSPRTVSDKDKTELFKIISISEKYYQETVEKIAHSVNKIAAYVPKRRERVQHIGLFGYSRGVGSVQLPRAIKFTGSLYSVGVPPEFIGAGRTLQQITTEQRDLVKQHYRYLIQDCIRAGKYVNKTNLKKLSNKDPSWKEIQQDIASAEELLGITLGPETDNEHEHSKLSTQILAMIEENKSEEKIQEMIEEAGVLRKSIG